MAPLKMQYRRMNIVYTARGVNLIRAAFFFCYGLIGLIRSFCDGAPVVLFLRRVLELFPWRYIFVDYQESLDRVVGQ